MARKNVYSYQGREYSFLDQVPEDLVCPICHELLDEPQQTQCGHLFCKKCLTRANQANNQPLGVGQGTGLGQPFGGGLGYRLEQPLGGGLGYRLEQSLGGGLGYRLEQPLGGGLRLGGNPQIGLSNQGLLGRQQQEESTLRLQKQQKCPICNTVYTQTPLNDKYNERRVKSLQVHCAHKNCGWAGTVGQAQEHLDNSCEYHTVPCTMNCGQQVIRHRLQSHIQNNCPERQVQCKYCLTNLKYGRLHDHYQSCKKVTQTCPNNCRTTNILAENMEDHLAECKEQFVDCIYKRIGCKKQMKRKDMQKHKDDSKDKHLELSLEQISALTEAFVDQQTKHATAVPKQVGLLSGLGSQMQPQSVSLPPKYPPSTLMSRPWLENSKLFPSLPWIIRFNNPSKQNTVARSGPFYTGVKGYMMCLQFHPDGETDKDFGFLSVNTTLRSGPNDNDLSWPLKQDTSITLLNQLEDRNHYTVKKAADDINPVSRAGLCMQLVGKAGRISHKDIYQPKTTNCVYFRDECLYFKVALHTTHKKLGLFLGQ